MMYPSVQAYDGLAAAQWRGLVAWFTPDYAGDDETFA